MAQNNKKTHNEKCCKNLFWSPGWGLPQGIEIPLPAMRSMQMRLQRIKMESRVAEEVFDTMKLKADCLIENVC